MERDVDPSFWRMLECAEEAAGFPEGQSYDDFLQDRKLQHALAKLVETVGESAARLTDAQRARVALPWRDIIGMRNLIVDAYFDIDLPTLYRTVEDDLPELIRTLRAALE